MKWLSSISPNAAADLLASQWRARGGDVQGSSGPRGVTPWFDATLHAALNRSKTQGDGQGRARTCNTGPDRSSRWRAEVASMLAKIRSAIQGTSILRGLRELLAMNMSRWAIPRVQWRSCAQRRRICGFAQRVRQLSDVYLANGQKDLALQNAKKALDLLGKRYEGSSARGTTFVIAQNKSEAVEVTSK